MQKLAPLLKGSDNGCGGPPTCGLSVVGHVRRLTESNNLGPGAAERGFGNEQSPRIPTQICALLPSAWDGTNLKLLLMSGALSRSARNSCLLRPIGTPLAFGVNYAARGGTPLYGLPRERLTASGAAICRRRHASRRPLRRAAAPLDANVPDLGRLATEPGP